MLALLFGMIYRRASENRDPARRMARDHDMLMTTLRPSFLHWPKTIQSAPLSRNEPEITLTEAVIRRANETTKSYRPLYGDYDAATLALLLKFGYRYRSCGPLIPGWRQFRLQQHPCSGDAPDGTRPRHHSCTWGSSRTQRRWHDFRSQTVGYRLQLCGNCCKYRALTRRARVRCCRQSGPVP